ncbi:MAG TPA: FAD-dependent oxidoreductase [Blastocatellia bacterium]|nr:FAD-dependent oxidoreductase [Blastocatellia bacterium]HMY74781.1 FAD-dependent oxidoreductase [Blastocatellia bacterium]HMZ20484.1 FAD-dependent oxidoreductase [Blastocatellia bacterium]HNG32298.1 FAD-dependent oxidoreductase [Blastocatellia bacterium]
MSNSSGHLVVTVGAGPAGIYGVRKLAEAGHEVILLNRDIKPGGLVEYGIYFNKHKLKEGVRKQFRQILADPRIHYVGHAKVGRQADLTLEELREVLQPSALVIASGAQGTKALGIPGDTALGVYHAKDLVYHYNGLPEFTKKEFQLGERVAIIGVGNVMVDIAHWLVHEKKTKEVIAVARRGPAQRAYTDVEIQSVAANFDMPAFDAELERVRPKLEAVGEDLAKIHKELTKYCAAKSKEGESPSKMYFRFLSSPTEVVVEDGKVKALRVENTELVKRGESLSAKGLGTHHDIECDAVIFAIGDKVDETMGLPCTGTEYIRNPTPDPENAGDEAYQVFDPEPGEVCAGLFVIGWSRQASDGVVGKAKQDGERGMAVVNRYLQKCAPGSAEGWEEKLQRFQELLTERGVRLVNYADVQKLEAVEREESQKRGVEFFKYMTDEDMLAAIDGV